MKIIPVTESYKRFSIVNVLLVYHLIGYGAQFDYTASKLCILPSGRRLIRAHPSEKTLRHTDYVVTGY